MIVQLKCYSFMHDLMTKFSFIFCILKRIILINQLSQFIGLSAEISLNTIRNNLIENLDQICKLMSQAN